VSASRRRHLRHGTRLHFYTCIVFLGITAPAAFLMSLDSLTMTAGPGLAAQARTRASGPRGESWDYTAFNRVMGHVYFGSHQGQPASRASCYTCFGKRRREQAGTAEQIVHSSHDTKTRFVHFHSHTHTSHCAYTHPCSAVHDGGDMSLPGGSAALGGGGGGCASRETGSSRHPLSTTLVNDLERRWTFCVHIHGCLYDALRRT